MPSGLLTTVRTPLAWASSLSLISSLLFTPLSQRGSTSGAEGSWALAGKKWWDVAGGDNVGYIYAPSVPSRRASWSFPLFSRCLSSPTCYHRLPLFRCNMATITLIDLTSDGQSCFRCRNLLPEKAFRRKSSGKVFDGETLSEGAVLTAVIACLRCLCDQGRDSAI